MKKIKFCTKNVIIAFAFLLCIVILITNISILFKVNYYKYEIESAYAYAEMYNYPNETNPNLKEIYLNLSYNANETNDYFSKLLNELYNSKNPYISFFANNELLCLFSIFLAIAYISLVVFINKDFLDNKKKKKVKI